MAKRLTRKDEAFKHSAAYIEWRHNVYARDGWACKICSHKGQDIEAHHIYPFRDYPELRVDVGNGITLCVACHRTLFGKERRVAEELLGLIDNGVNSVELLPGSAGDNTEPSQVGNDLEGVTTRGRVFDIERFRKKAVRCKGCGKTIHRYFYEWEKAKKGFVCSPACKSKWFRSKDFKGKNSGNYKSRERQKCLYCGKFTSTPSDRNRDKKYCNNSCQLKYELKHGLRVNEITKKAGMTHCQKGHPFDEKNTYNTVDRYGKKHRQCKACKKQREAKYRAKKRKDSNTSTSALPVKG